MSLCNIDSWFFPYRITTMSFTPCAAGGCHDLPLFGHLKCLRHVRCIAPRKGLWDPASCHECRPLVAMYKKQPSAPSPLHGMWTAIGTYFKHNARQAPKIADPELHSAFIPKVTAAKRKATPLSTPSRSVSPELFSSQAPGTSSPGPGPSDKGGKDNNSG